MPSLARFSRVCSLWRRVAASPSLWRNVDLSSWPRERHRTEVNLKWLIDNRLNGSRELNLSNWKIKNVDCVVEHLLDSAPELQSLSLSGWKELTSDQLLYLVEQFDKLQRIELSSINVSMMGWLLPAPKGSQTNQVQKLHVKSLEVSYTVCH